MRVGRDSYDLRVSVLESHPPWFSKFCFLLISSVTLIRSKFLSFSYPQNVQFEWFSITLAVISDWIWFSISKQTQQSKYTPVADLRKRALSACSWDPLNLCTGCLCNFSFFLVRAPYFDLFCGALTAIFFGALSAAKPWHCWPFKSANDTCLQYETIKKQYRLCEKSF